MIMFSFGGIVSARLHLLVLCDISVLSSASSMLNCLATHMYDENIYKYPLLSTHIQPQIGT